MVEDETSLKIEIDILMLLLHLMTGNVLVHTKVKGTQQQ